MRWKLTGRFLISIISIVVLVILANTAILIYLTISESKKGLHDYNSYQPVQFTRDLSKYMYMDENDLPTLNKEGLELINQRNIWVQFLDDHGYVIHEVNTPSDTPKHYRPVDLIQDYKYNEFDKQVTIFISEFEQYSYILGIQKDIVSRQVITYNPKDLVNIVGKYVLYIIVIDLVITVIVGLLFSSVLTKPLYKMMDHIQRLKNRNLTPNLFKKTGIYKTVFKNIEDVAIELKNQDIERKKLEQMRNEWISNVSHDMKTPLASIQGYAELMQDASPEEKEQYSAIIEKKAIYMHELLNDFTLALRLKNNNIPLNLQQVNIEAFMRELIIDILNDPKFSSRQIEFESTESSLNVSIDEHLMRRAITNLIINSFVHNDEQTSVKVSLTTSHNQVKIEISDNGKGMSEEDVAHVFDRYYRGSYTENVHGSGLGTAIARDIIEVHKGSITLESKQNQGTKITILL